MTPPEIRIATEACEQLGISRSALQSWLDKGWITGQQLSNGTWVFTDDEIERARAEHGRAEQVKAPAAASP